MQRHLAQPMQKIALNHMQLVALAASFPLRWQKSLRLFTTFESGDAGDYLYNPACADPDARDYGGGSLFQEAAHGSSDAFHGKLGALWIIARLHASAASG